MTAPFRTVELTAPDLRHAGRVDATVFSRALGRRADCTFWVPEGLGGRPAPLVTVLHGVYGSHWSWWGSGAANLVAAELIAGGRLPACVLAMPSDGLIGHGSGYVRQPGADVASWILDEVPALAALVEPTVDEHAPLALIGLSMGGFGALRLALAAPPGRVPAAAGLSSITAIEQMALFGVDPLPEVSSPADRSILGALDARTGGPPRVYLACGRDDLLIEHNRALHDSLTARGVEHRWIEDDGRHDWAYWRRHLPAALEFIAPSLAGGKV